MLSNRARMFFGFPPKQVMPLSFDLFKYTKEDGTFDYEAYRQIQEDGNRQKIGNSFADEKTMGFIADYLRPSSPKRGLCHGTRRGLEQEWLSEMLDADVIGTEISPTASDFPRTVQWDFHEENPEWVGAFDFVYTNSHDHAFDPPRAIRTWVRQLKPTGTLLIEHCSKHPITSRPLDPFGVRAEVLPYLVAMWGKGDFAVTEILDPGHEKPNGAKKIWIFVIRPLRQVAASPQR